MMSNLNISGLKTKDDISNDTETYELKINGYSEGYISSIEIKTK